MARSRATIAPNRARRGGPERDSARTDDLPADAGVGRTEAADGPTEWVFRLRACGGLPRRNRYRCSGCGPPGDVRAKAAQLRPPPFPQVSAKRSMWCSCSRLFVAGGLSETLAGTHAPEQVCQANRGGWGDSLATRA